MRVKALTTFNSYFGTLLEGEERDVRAGEGLEYQKAGLVEILEEDTEAEEPKKGKDMTSVSLPTKKK